MSDRTSLYRLSPDIICFGHRGGTIVAEGGRMRPILLNASKDEVSEILENISSISPFCIDDIKNCLPDSLIEAFIESAVIYDVHPNQSKVSNPRRITEKPEHVSLFLVLNQYCNLACVYCLEGKETYEAPARREMSFEIAKRGILSFLDLLAPGGHLGITLFGGEPLLSWPTILKILDFCKNAVGNDVNGRTISFAMQTNLSFIPEGFIEVVKENQIYLTIDVDGPPEVQNRLRPMKGRNSNSFDRVKMSIGTLSEHGVPYMLRCTLTSLNVGILEEVEQTHASLGSVEPTELGLLRPVNSDGFVFPSNLMPGYNDIADAITSGLDRNSSLINRYVDRYRDRAGGPLDWKHGCNAGFGLLPTLTYDGKIYPCTWFVGNKELEIGDLAASPIVCEEAVRHVENCLHIDHDPICSTCSYRGICGGGCGVTRVLTNYGQGSPLKTVAMDQARSMQCAITKTLTNYILSEAIEKQLSAENAF
ncbi:radical SAM additional 4Fe4S-binding SPASM domain-containing protein [Methylobacterium sp. UNC378MF]|uniref:radical SAM/SPASM domain-containing protein n=1 Tax=Methylobacterium sp. UNC378MF TaxID=1502748 RepID=UPI0008825C24|nr:radical SAM protein [Methylobacterium sp. UNC378MF]SDA35457.1 radical SAM additional 4Fe4S-binding SPASM domain-containing protein [Methylobacterium sp. UNC378MF]